VNDPPTVRASARPTASRPGRPALTAGARSPWALGNHDIPRPALPVGKHLSNGTRPSTPPPRMESLRVRNYRALRDLELKDVSSLTVLPGPNGSGKPTVFDVFAFLSESFTSGLRRAWDRRGRF
jgi:hypothetical protein